MEGGLHGFIRERDKEEERGKRDRREERETNFLKFEVNLFISLKFPNKSSPRILGSVITPQV